MNLFDNAKAQRQIKTSGNEEERDRRIELENGGTRGRVTSHDIFAVNNPLGEETPSLSKNRNEKQFRNNSIRQSIRSSGGFHWMEDANSVETLSPVLKSVFSDPLPSKKKIEAYINAVYEQATRERAKEKDDRSKNLSTENNFTYFNDSKNRLGEWNDGSLIHGLVVSDPRNQIVKLKKLKSERGFRKTNSRKDNRRFLEPEECDRSSNFSESGNPEGRTRDRPRGAARLENTFDYTPMFLAIQSSRIPKESQFSRQTQRNAFSNLSDKGSFATTIEFFTSIPLRNDINENINENINDIMPSTIKSNRSEGDMFALLSKIAISGAHRSMVNGKRQYGFRIPENIPDNVNSLRNALAEKRNLSAAAFRNGNARSEAMEVENANVSTRISTLVPAFTRLRNLSSSSSSSTTGISRLEELPSPTARPGDKSSTEILGSRTRGSLPANEVQGFSDEFSNLYKGRESHTIYSSLQQKTPKDVNLKNSYKFWKPSRRKLRKWKGTGKFREDKGVGGDPKQGKSLLTRELIWENRGSNFKCDPSSIETCLQRRPRRHLRIENDSNSTKSENLAKDEDSYRKMQAIVDHYARPEIVYYKRKLSQNRGNRSPRKQAILESGHSYKKVRSEEGDNPFFFNKESGKESNVDKRIKDKFARISNVLKEDSAEVRIIQETSKNLKAATESKVTRADISEIQDKLKNDSFSRKSDKPDEFATHEATSEYPAGLIDTRQRSVMNQSFFAITKSMTTNNEITTISAITLKDDSIDYKESASLQSREKLSDTIIGPFLSPPITRKLSHNASKQTNLESTSPICTNTTTKVFVSKLSSQIPPGRNVDGYFAVANGSLSVLSNNCTNSKETTMYSEALNNRSESERDEAENVRFLELNNVSSRMIASNFTGPRGSPIRTDLLLRGSGSITEPAEAWSDEEGEEGSCYIRDPLRENTVDVPESEDSTTRSQRSRERDEIAELVSRIVRQYVAYTPVMPGMPTFDEITEAETLPPEETTTVTTTLATTTRITDATFRPLKTLRLLETTMLSREMHDEIALDETTFVDETEATTISRKTTISRWKFRTGKSDTSIAEGKVDRVSSEIGKSEKRRKIFNRVANTKMMDGERKIEDHPWHRTTEMQQIIAVNGSKPAQKTEGRRKKQRYKSKSDYFPNASSTTISSSIDDVILETRSKRSDFIRESNDRDSSIFYDYEEEDNEDRAQNGRMAWSKNGKSPDMTTESSELRSRIEKGLAGKLKYSTNQKSFRHSSESRDRTQKHNASPRDIAARDIKFAVNNRDDRYLDSSAQEKERNPQDDSKNVALLKLRHVKDDAVGRFDEGVISQNREAISASLEIPFPAKILTSRKDLSGSLSKRPKMDRRTGKRGFAGRAAKIAGARKIASNPLEDVRTASANPDDLSNRGAESAMDRILTGFVKSSGGQDKNRQTDTVIRGAKLMIADDKGGTRDVVTKSARYKKTPLVYGAKQWKRKDARKINENHAKNPRVHRVFVGDEYFRRPPGEVYDSIRKTIGKVLKEKSSSVSDDRNIAGRHVDRSLTDHRYRSSRRLLSSGKSSYIEDAEGEYYDDDGSETEGENDSVSDNEATARRDDLSDLENQPILHEDRDSRKLLPETDRLADENADAARAVMPEERTLAACDTVISDVQGVGEGAIPRFFFILKNTNYNIKYILSTSYIAI